MVWLASGNLTRQEWRGLIPETAATCVRGQGLYLQSFRFRCREGLLRQVSAMENTYFQWLAGGQLIPPLRKMAHRVSFPDID